MTYPRIHENEIHLHKGEDHLQQGVDAAQNHVAGRVKGNFEKHPKLQPVVDHGAQSESYTGNPLIKHHLSSDEKIDL